MPDLAQAYGYYLAEHRHPLNRATHFIGIPILVVSAVVCPILGAWTTLAVAWVIGWAFQLLGHRIEGNRPALLRRPASFLLGPLMVLVEMVGFLGVRFAFAERAHRDLAPR